MTTLTEADVEDAALEWLRDLGWQTAHGPDIGPDQPGEERADYGAVVLEQRLRDALARLNPDLPFEALDDAYRKLTRPEGSTLEARNRAFHRMLVGYVPRRGVGKSRSVGNFASTCVGRRLRHAKVPWVSDERGSKRAAIKARPDAREPGPAAAARRADPSARSHSNEASRPSLLVVALPVLARLAFHPGDGAAGDGHPLAPPGVARVLDVEEPSPTPGPAAYQRPPTAAMAVASR